MRHQRGAHYEKCQNYKNNSRLKTTDFLEGVDQGPVNEVSQEKLVATGDRCRDVTKGQRRTVHLSVREFPTGCDDNTDHVQDERDAEVL